MSQLVILVLPAPATLDTIREALTPRFSLNPKVEGLGDIEELEELQAIDTDGRTASIFCTIPARPDGMLAEKLQQRGLDPTAFRCFTVEYSWAATGEAPALAAESLGGWLYDSWSNLLSPAEFRQQTSRDSAQ